MHLEKKPEQNKKANKNLQIVFCTKKNQIFSQSPRELWKLNFFISFQSNAKKHHVIQRQLRDAMSLITRSKSFFTINWSLLTSILCNKD